MTSDLSQPKSKKSRRHEIRKEAYEKYAHKHNPHYEVDRLNTEGTDENSSTPVVGIEGSVNQAKLNPVWSREPGKTKQYSKSIVSTDEILKKYSTTKNYHKSIQDRYSN